MRNKRAHCSIQKKTKQNDNNKNPTEVGQLDPVADPETE